MYNFWKKLGRFYNTKDIVFLKSKNRDVFKEQKTVQFLKCKKQFCF